MHDDRSTPTPEALLEAAVDLARRGHRVFPVSRNDKAPRLTKPDGSGDPLPLADWQDPTKGGFHEGVCDPDIVRGWWEAHPGSSIAYAIPPGQVALDLDGDEQQDLDAKLALLAEHYPDVIPLIEQTYTVRSTREHGGLHVYLTLPPDVGVKLGTTGAAERQYPAHHLRRIADVKAGGKSYTVLPPSWKLADGVVRVYEGHGSLDVLAAAPPSVVAALVEEPPARSARRGVNLGPSSFQQHGEEPETLPQEPLPKGTRRHPLLFAEACSMRGRGYGEAAILGALRGLNRQCFQDPKADAKLVEMAAWVCGNYPPGDRGAFAAAHEAIEKLRSGASGPTPDNFADAAREAASGAPPGVSKPTEEFPMGLSIAVTPRMYASYGPIPPDPSLLAPLLVGKGQSVLLAGLPGAGKSTMLRQVVRSITLGEPWFDVPGEHVWPSGNVLVITEEGRDSWVSEAHRTWPGERIRRTLIWGVNELAKDSNYAKLQSICAQAQPLLVIIDTLEMAIGDMSATVDGLPPLKRLEKLLEALNASAGPDVAVVCTAHTVKDTAARDVLGGSPFKGAVLGTFHVLVTLVEGADGSRHLHVEKSRHGTPRQRASGKFTASPSLRVWEHLGASDLRMRAKAKARTVVREVVPDSFYEAVGRLVGSLQRGISQLDPSPAPLRRLVTKNRVAEVMGITKNTDPWKALGKGIRETVEDGDG